MSVKRIKMVMSVLLIVLVMMTAAICMQVSAAGGFTVSGYVDTSFTYSTGAASDILSDFNVTVDGTQISCKTDSEGYFELENVPASTSGYTFKISKSGYLARSISDIPVSNNIILSVKSVSIRNLPIEMWAGDFNGDLAINISDIMVLAKCFNTIPSDVNYKLSCDLNRDSSINITDIMIAVAHFNKAATDYPENVTSTVVQVSTPVPTYTNTATSTIKASPTNTPVPSLSPVLDDWNYVSAEKSIHIKKVQKGSGTSMVTYYVADVKLNGDSTLQSAFGNNKFGDFSPATSAKLSKIAADNNAIFAFNGDYYSYRDDGYEIRNGTLYRDTQARDCLILYKNGLMETANESSISASALLSKGAYQVLSFGPILVKSGTALTTFNNVPSDQGADYLLQTHPRTGIGMIEPNHFIIIVVDGRVSESIGMGMVDFAKTFADLGCKEAYNLDGGGSAEMYFNGRVVNRPNGGGNERSISDALYVTK